MSGEAVVFAMGSCFGCRAFFSFNPHKVPSHRHEGVREPVCENCMAIINTERKARGLEPFAIEPDAYSAIPESEL
jgi:hypothetical protein